MTYSVTSGPATISGSTVTITGVGTVVLVSRGSDHELHHRHYQHQLHRGSSNADAGLHGHHRHTQPPPFTGGSASQPAAER